MASKRKRPRRGQRTVRRPASAPQTGDVRLLEAALPMLRLYGAVLKQFLEPQLLFLRWYERWLERGAASGSLEDRQREMLKALMSAYLDAAQSMPGLGERVSQSQAEMIKAYRHTVEDLLRHVDGTR